MTTVSVVYHSGSGTTRLLAEAVHAGAGRQDGVAAHIHEIVGEDIERGRWSNAAILDALADSDAIVFGCPTYMGSISAQLKSFFDATLELWYPRRWADKLAAGFSVSSTPSGDKLNALTSMAIFALQHGMIWVGQEQTPLNADGLNRLSVYMGAAAQPDYTAEAPTLVESDRLSGELLGARVARIALQMSAGRGSSAS
jgi:NAD(P)H dehydrogenase (quinone)